MGLFKRKPDPISDRARALNQQIASLEARIKRLSAEEARAPTPPKPDSQTPTSSPAQASSPPAVQIKAVAQPTPPPGGAQPRLRSTALPHHRQAGPPKANSPPAREPVFEEVDHERLQGGPESVPAEREDQLEVRQYGPSAFWHRLKNHFRGPLTSNPKLVNYLAAGSIQGLRPLRYERRVARNRFVFFVLCLVALLWGLIYMFFRRPHG